MRGQHSMDLKYCILAKQENLELRITRQLEEMETFAKAVEALAAVPHFCRKTEQVNAYCQEGLALLKDAHILSLDLAQLAVLFKSLENLGLNIESLIEMNCGEQLDQIAGKAEELHNVAQKIMQCLIVLFAQSQESKVSLMDLSATIH